MSAALTAAFWLLAAALVDVGVVDAQVRARVVLDNRGRSPVTGVLELTQTAQGLFIDGSIAGLAPGRHGFHAHQFGNITTCDATGPHYNPRQMNHGAPQDLVRHVGDLGNIVAGPDGVARVRLMDRLQTLVGVETLLGRSYVVHQGVDDLGRGSDRASLENGNSGPRLACGIVVGVP